MNVQSSVWQGLLLTLWLFVGCRPEPRVENEPGGRTAQLSTTRAHGTSGATPSDQPSANLPGQAVVDGPKPASTNASSGPTLCELTAPGAPSPVDPLRALSPHLLVETNQGGGVFRVNKVGAELSAVQERFERLGLRTFSFFPCETHIVLWIPGGNLCDKRELSSNLASLAKYLPSFDLVSCIEYFMNTYYEDCETGRLPRDRCRERISEELKQDRCGVIGDETRAAVARAALAVGLVKDVAGVCGLRPATTGR